MEVLRVHPAEDESLNSLLTLGICKALAITGCVDPWQVRYDRISEDLVPIVTLPLF